MKKKNIKLISYILCFTLVMSFGCVFASGDGAEEVIKNISNSILNVLTWFAYAIAMGALLFIGIKYLTSSANEKANLKNLMPIFLIGMILIACAFTIAKTVANIAGNETADKIIEAAEQLGITLEDKEIEDKEAEAPTNNGDGNLFLDSLEAPSEKAKEYLNMYNNSVVIEKTNCGGPLRPEKEHLWMHRKFTDEFLLECAQCGATLDLHTVIPSSQEPSEEPSEGSHIEFPTLPIPPTNND